jgi:hypothetical protein
MEVGSEERKGEWKSKAKDQYTPLVSDWRRTRWNEDKEVETGMFDRGREKDGIRDITAKVHLDEERKREMEDLVCHD